MKKIITTALLTLTAYFANTQITIESATPDTIIVKMNFFQKETARQLEYEIKKLEYTETRIYTSLYEEIDTITVIKKLLQQRQENLISYQTEMDSLAESETKTQLVSDRLDTLNYQTETLRQDIEILDRMAKAHFEQIRILTDSASIAHNQKVVRNHELYDFIMRVARRPLHKGHYNIFVKIIQGDLIVRQYLFC